MSVIKKWIALVSVVVVSLCVLLGLVVGSGDASSAVPEPTATSVATVTSVPTSTAVPTSTVRPTSTRIPTVTPVPCKAEVEKWASEMSPIMKLWSEAMTAGEMGLFNVTLDNSLRIYAKLAFVTPPSCEPRAKQFQDLLSVANDALSLSMTKLAEGNVQESVNAMIAVTFAQEEALRILNSITEDYR